MELPDTFLETLKYAEATFYPDIRQLLIIGCVSPISSTEVGRAVSGVRRVKTPHCETIFDKTKGNLNLI